MQNHSVDRDRPGQAALTPESREHQPARRGRQLTFGWDGDDSSDLPRKVEVQTQSREDLPAHPGRTKASKFAPRQMVFEWFEHPPTATDN